MQKHCVFCLIKHFIRQNVIIINYDYMRQCALNKLRKNRKTAEIEVTGQFNPTTDDNVEKWSLFIFVDFSKKE